MVESAKIFYGSPNQFPSVGDVHPSGLLRQPPPADGTRNVGIFYDDEMNRMDDDDDSTDGSIDGLIDVPRRLRTTRTLQRRRR